MKQFKFTIFTLICVVVGLQNVYAKPSYSVSTTSSYIEAGSKVTASITLSNVKAWNIKIKSYGATSGCDQNISDTADTNITKTISVTCTATSVGQISFVFYGDAVSSGETEATNIDATKIVVVTAPREKDSNNYLKSIGVTGYTLTPEFNQDTLEYSVDVPATVDKVTLEASAASSYATVSGTGEVEVNEGANSFEIKVTSETGVERIYKVTVNVKDENPIEVSIDGNSYTVMKNAKNLETPSTYEATTVKINDFDIPAFYSETSKYTLVGVKDSKGDTFFAIYDKDKNSYTLYNENKSDQLLLYIRDITSEMDGFVKDKVTINEVSYDCFKSNDGSLTLVYAMNIVTGKEDYYLYDKEENTFLLYDDSLIVSLTNEVNKYKMTILYMAAAIIFLIIVIFGMLLKRSKKKVRVKYPSDEVKVEKISPEIKKNEEVKKKKNVKEDVKEEAQKMVDKQLEDSTVKNNKDRKNKKKSKDEAIDEVNKASEIIENYEKTIRLSQKELAKKKKEMEEKEKNTEVTMYDIFEDDRKKKSKKKKKKN